MISFNLLLMNQFIRITFPAIKFNKLDFNSIELNRLNKLFNIEAIANR